MSILIDENAKFSVRIVGIFELESELPYTMELVKPAIEIAIEKAQREFPLITWNAAFRNSSRKCSSNYAGVFAAEEFYLRRVTAFIGPACGLALDPVARMAAHWNRPIFSSGGVDSHFSNKKIYSTLTRLSISLEGLGTFAKYVFKLFEWKHIAMIVHENTSSPLIPLIRRSLEEALAYSNDYDIVLDIHEINRPFDRVNLSRIMHECAKETRIIILITTGENVRKLLLTAYDLGMGNGEYAFLSVELFKNSKSFGNFAWYVDGDSRNEDARVMYESLMIFTVPIPINEEYNQFVGSVIEKSHNDFNTTFDRSDVNIIILGFHDSIMLYGMALSEIISYGSGDLMNGYNIARLIWNRSYTGLLSGDIHINANGDKESAFALTDFDPEIRQMKIVLYYTSYNNTITFVNNTQIHWPGNMPPSDFINCELNKDDLKCSSIVNDVFPYIGFVRLIIITILFVLAIIGFTIYRRIALETDLSNMRWRVKWDDITLFSGSERSFDGIPIEANKDVQIHDKQTQEIFINAEKRDKCKVRTEISVTIPRRGLYKGMKIAIKPLNIRRVTLSRNILLELKQLLDLSHENLIRFIGFCPEEPYISLLTEYSQKGNLRDLLDNEAIRVDWPFQCSIICDIIEGMCFIHDSVLQYHGMLKSTNCVIDSRLVVKLTDFGLRTLRNQSAQFSTETDYRSLLWTAPEHLRQKHPELHGSQKGDIFSFSIVLQEIVTRTGPFETAKISFDGSAASVIVEPELIINKLKNVTEEPFRPELIQCECPQEILDIIKECWDETPSNRPSFCSIKQRIKKLSKSLGGSNFLENLLLRMEQYANDLERLVEEKTAAFFEEKRKCEDILYEVLPRYVAEQLKAGHHVRPEAFECVTILFSDTVDFAQLSAESTPLEIVEFLNDLYTCFDAIIGNYDVYKVETIGDAYMVVSGLPIRNGNDHAREIANMSLALLEGIKRFHIKHIPNRKVQLRIGIHSGPVAAGVIGLKTPRYCIMGDTVNTASRMESNGQANKIHISSQTKSILDKFGTFRMTLRGDIELKGKGTVRTFWLINEECSDHCNK